MPETIAIVGLGYVGLPLAVAFGAKQRTLGFDISGPRIVALRNGSDQSGEMGASQLASAVHLEYTDTPERLGEADIVIVTVPTPVDSANRPDLSPLIQASETIGRHMKRGALVIYESTVYPGATEEICIPALERASGFIWKQDFFVGYSPERINPGDRERTLPKVVKVVGGDSPGTLAKVAAIYGTVVTAGIHPVSSIKVAEAAKVIENTQRDLNIAFMNELAVIFKLMDIDTLEVLEAAGTKWNFLPFRPGLVGGHCIGVDPYYLTHKAETLGYHPHVILAGRYINDSMGAYIAQQTVKRLIQAGCAVKGSRVLVLGLTFKEDCADTRNSKVADVIRELREFGCEVEAHDPWVDPAQVVREFGIPPRELADLKPGFDAVVFAVAHAAFRKAGLEGFAPLLRSGGLVVDVKGMVSRQEILAKGFHCWRL